LFYLADPQSFDTQSVKTGFFYFGALSRGVKHSAGDLENISILTNTSLR